MTATRDRAPITVRFIVEGAAETLLPELQRLGTKGVRTAELRFQVPFAGLTCGEDFSLGVIADGNVRAAYQMLDKLDNQARVTQETDSRVADFIQAYGRLTG